MSKLGHILTLNETRPVKNYLVDPEAWIISISLVIPLAACWKVKFTIVSWAEFPNPKGENSSKMSWNPPRPLLRKFRENSPKIFLKSSSGLMFAWSLKFWTFITTWNTRIEIQLWSVFGSLTRKVMLNEKIIQNETTVLSASKYDINGT